MDFVWFSSALPNASFDEKIQGKTSRQALSQLLYSGRNICWAKMFDYAPLDLQGIEKLAASYGKPKTLGEISSILSNAKPGVLEGQLRPFVKIKSAEQMALDDPQAAKKMKADPVDFAFAYFIFCLWRSAYPQSIAFVQKGKPEKQEVRFAVNHDGWVLVKKGDLKAEPKEILLALASIFASTNRKSIDYAMEKPDEFEAFVESFLATFPMRKSFAKLPALLSEALKQEEKLAKFACHDNVCDRALLELVKQSFFLSCFEYAGFPPFIALDTIGGVYPDLKIPKPRGNFGGKKKKK
ncbi:TPA: hypothetical protein HA244_06690 [Candidatus Micrarchaeota archaeon]|nr:hypothetical protein [Candidatus Micrarchaeota archaeon]